MSSKSADFFCPRIFFRIFRSPPEIEGFATGYQYDLFVCLCAQVQLRQLHGNKGPFITILEFLLFSACEHYEASFTFYSVVLAWPVLLCARSVSSFGLLWSISSVKSPWVSNDINSTRRVCIAQMLKAVIHCSETQRQVISPWHDEEGQDGRISLSYTILIVRVQLVSTCIIWYICQRAYKQIHQCEEIFGIRCKSSFPSMLCRCVWVDMPDYYNLSIYYYYHDCQWWFVFF